MTNIISNNREHSLLDIRSRGDIPQEYQNTPIGLLLEYHNLNREFDSYDSAQLLVGMCMDNRKHLHIPENFSFIIRAGGANLRPSEFKISYVIAVAGIRYIALIGHDQCSMVNVMARKERFIQGLIDGAGWDREEAKRYFLKFAPMFEIGNEVDFVQSEAKRLRLKYPKIVIAPLIYRVQENRLYLIEETE